MRGAEVNLPTHPHTHLLPVASCGIELVQGACMDSLLCPSPQLNSSFIQCSWLHLHPSCKPTVPGTGGAATLGRLGSSPPGDIGALVASSPDGTIFVHGLSCSWSKPQGSNLSLQSQQITMDASQMEALVATASSPQLLPNSSSKGKGKVQASSRQLLPATSSSSSSVQLGGAGATEGEEGPGREGAGSTQVAAPEEAVTAKEGAEKANEGVEWEAEGGAGVEAEAPPLGEEGTREEEEEDEDEEDAPKALRGVTFRLEPGELLGVVGESGR